MRVARSEEVRALVGGDPRSGSAPPDPAWYAVLEARNAAPPFARSPVFRRSWTRRWVWPIAAIAVLEGCVPRCEATCRKLLDCGDELDTQRIALALCEDSCIREDALYESWEDESKQEAFDEERRCIRESTCVEIADGACYDQEIFPFVGYGG